MSSTSSDIWGSIPCVFCVDTSVMGFQKNWIEGWVGVVSSIQFLFGFLEFFNFAKPPRAVMMYNVEGHTMKMVFLPSEGSYFLRG